MPAYKDICRICLQETDYQDAEEISLPKLQDIVTSRPFINYSFLRKWQVDLFEDHLICNTCIQNFRTMIRIYRNAYKANTAIATERSRHQLSKVNLKRLQRFGHIEGDFIVCRLCLEPTSQIAVYLYDNSRNILPAGYIEKMVRHLKIYTNFDRTINPIICRSCWQNIQISYSFSKHLEVVSGKLSYYQTMFNKMFVNREDLLDILARWDRLGTLNIKTEMEIEIKKECKKESEPELSDVTLAERLMRLKRNVATVRKEYSLYDDHSYVKLTPNIENMEKNKAEENSWTPKTKRKTRNFVNKDSSCEMPILTSHVEEEECLKEMPKLTPNIKTYVKDKSGTKGQPKGQTLNLAFDKNQQKEAAKSLVDKNVKTATNTRSKEWLRATAETEEAVPAMQRKLPIPTDMTYKEKLRGLKKYDKATSTKAVKHKERIDSNVKKEKVLHALQSKQKDNSKNKILKILVMENSRPRTRLSTKKETVVDPLSQDLLVLRREEIVKDKKQKRKPNASSLEYTSTPKISRTTYKPIPYVNASLPENTPTPKISKISYKSNYSVPTVSTANLPGHTPSPKISKNSFNPKASFSAIESSPSKSNTEYTFEILNLDSDVQVKREVIEEEELQIKREILSECDSDDHFSENTGCNANNLEDFDDECPNLEHFIKSEPTESFVMDLDEEEPPELEFQGPCNVPVPIPCFTIQNTFTVDEKRHLINTVDEKRGLLNTLDEKTTLVRSTVDDTRSAVNGTDDKRNVVAPSAVKRSSFLTSKSNLSNSNTDKPEQKTLFIKVKQDLFKNMVKSKTQEKIVSPQFGRSLVINVTKSDKKAMLVFKEDKKEESNSASSNANTESHAGTSSKHSDDQSTMVNIYSSLDSIEISKKKPYFCQMCDFATIYYKAAKSHLALHMTNSLHLYHCEMCTFASPRKTRVMEHMFRVHPGEQHFVGEENSKDVQKRGWSIEDSALLQKHFAKNIKNGTYPSSEEVKKFSELTGIKRPVTVIKAKIQYLMKQKIKLCYLFST